MKVPFFILGVLLLLIVVIEIIGLAYIYTSVPRFETYWKDRRSKRGELIYVALGDSTAQGVGASRASHSYAGVIAERLENKTGKSVRIINLSKSGARISDVLHEQLPAMQNYPEPDIVTIEIGANDVSGFQSQTFKSDFAELIKLLPEGAYVSDLPDFGDGPNLRNQQLGARIARTIIAQRSDVHFVPLESYTQQHFNHLLHYSFDFFHPNNQGYKVWADAFWSEIQKDLYIE